MILLLSHSDSDISDRAESTLQQVFSANPELAQPYLDKLILLLSHSDSDISDRAGSTLQQVFSANPELAEPHLNQFRDLLSDPDSKIVSGAIFSFGGVLADNPEARRYVEKLVDLLSDSNVGDRAGSTLQQVFSANPELAQPHLEQLIALLYDSDPKISSNAADCFGPVLAVNPELALQHIEQLVNLLSDPNPEISFSSIGSVLAANPELAQPHIDKLVALLSNPGLETYQIASSLEEVLMANPELAQPHIEPLIALLSDPDPRISLEVGLRISSVFVTIPELAEPYIDELVDLLSNRNPFLRPIASNLDEVLMANPELVLQQHIEKLVDLLSDDSVSAPVVGKLMANNPSYASEEVIQSLRKQLENSATHSDAVLVLAHAYAHQDSPFLLEKLTDPRNTLERPVAARALFFKALQQPNQDADIGEELLKLSKSQEPLVRIWANKTLAMLDLATQAHAAAELEGEQREEVDNRLRNFRELDFFGEDFTWAANEALYWLEKRKNEEKAQTAAK